MRVRSFKEIGSREGSAMVAGEDGRGGCICRDGGRNRAFFLVPRLIELPKICTLLSSALAAIMRGEELVKESLTSWERWGRRGGGGTRLLGGIPGRRHPDSVHQRFAGTPTETDLFLVLGVVGTKRAPCDWPSLIAMALLVAPLSLFN